MKKLVLLLGVFLISAFTNAQNPNVEKNLTGAQIGLYGLDIYNETRLIDQIALRIEASLFPIKWNGYYYEKTGFDFFSPAITIQPKYYYNIGKRAEKGKNTNNNSANYFGLHVSYIPDWFFISNRKSVVLSNQIHFIPTYGIRRIIAENINFEIKAGFGYCTSTGDNREGSAIFEFSVKIGYDF